MGDLYDSKRRRRTRGRTTGENKKVKETSGLFNFSISVINKQTRFQTLETTGLGAMQGAMSLGVDTLKVLAGTSEFQVGSYIIGSADYFNDFAFGLLDAGTM